MLSEDSVQACQQMEPGDLLVIEVSKGANVEVVLLSRIEDQYHFTRAARDQTAQCDEANPYRLNENGEFVDRNGVASWWSAKASFSFVQPGAGVGTLEQYRQLELYRVQGFSDARLHALYTKIGENSVGELIDVIREASWPLGDKLATLTKLVATLPLEYQVAALARFLLDPGTFKLPQRHVPRVDFVMPESAPDRSRFH